MRLCEACTAVCKRRSGGMGVVVSGRLVSRVFGAGQGVYVCMEGLVMVLEGYFLRISREEEEQDWVWRVVELNQC